MAGQCVKLAAGEICHQLLVHIMFQKMLCECREKFVFNGHNFWTSRQRNIEKNWQHWVGGLSKQSQLTQGRKPSTSKHRKNALIFIPISISYSTPYGFSFELPYLYDILSKFRGLLVYRKKHLYFISVSGVYLL
jgi:hypothetical protein